MQRAWQDLKKGWQEAGWGDYFVLALFPVVMVTALLDRLIEGTICGPLFWVLIVPAVPALLFWAGLASGLQSWLGRITFAIALVFLCVQLIKRMLREGKTEATFTRRIGRIEVTVPIKKVDEEKATTISPPPPSWWQRSRRAFETISAAFHTAAHATWTP